MASRRTMGVPLLAAPDVQTDDVAQQWDIVE
jgi:hypothetical protein